MEFTAFAWLLVVLALILGFLAGYFRFKPQVPPLLYEGKIFDDGDPATIPATGGTVNFKDEMGYKFQIQLPEQIPHRPITFTKVNKNNYEPLFLEDGRENPKVPNPGRKHVRRIIIKLEATDAEKKKVEYFNPMMTTIWNYTEQDLGHVKGDHTRLRRFYNDGIEWIELGMPKDAVDTKKRTLTAFVASFSSCGGGDH